MTVNLSPFKTKASQEIFAKLMSWKKRDSAAAANILIQTFNKSRKSIFSGNRVLQTFGRLLNNPLEWRHQSSFCIL